MKLTIEVTKDSVYMRTDKLPKEGGYSLALFRDGIKDSLGYDGDESKRALFLEIADCLLDAHLKL